MDREPNKHFHLPPQLLLVEGIIVEWNALPLVIGCKNALLAADADGC